VAVPSGVVSFLFTDVEGSTRLWESDRDAMAASLARHDEILREVVESRSGHVFSTAGDAFAVAFPSAASAVEAAIDAQLWLNRADWPGPPITVRMGIHTGTAEERDGDYFGPVLNRAARIMSAGHGGQILISSVTAEAIDDPLNDLGTHHLKDLEEPEHIFEVLHPDLPFVSRPIKTVDVRRHNLPDYLTSFVGRTRELAEIDELIQDARLVVLTGTGGTGKTRLAMEAARQSMERFPDGVWVVELAPVTNPAFIMSTIGDVWGLRPGEGASIEDVVTRYLWGRELLLVVDNCEHLIDGASDAIRQLLNGAPKVRILATSRESLGIGGESLMRVPSLGLPDSSHPGDAEAVLLFLDRARSAHADYRPSADDMGAIWRICTRIDGIPLGLELAAARLRSMSTLELASRLDESFRILSTSKTAIPRQRTLQATIDWSHELLKPQEQVVFRRASQFAGGFDLQSAEAVCSGDEVNEWEVLDNLDSLIDKSLIIPSQHPDLGTRYRMLEPVRQYAADRLDAAGEKDATLAAHARRFVEFVAEASPHTRGPDQMPWERRLDADYDNIRVAFHTLLETGDFGPYLTMGFDLFLYWMHLGIHLEGVTTLVAGLEQAPADLDPNIVIKAWATAAGLGAEITDPASIAHARTGLEVAKVTGDPNLIGRMEVQLGASINHSTTDPEYLEHLLEGRRLLDANPEPYWWEPEWERAFLNLIYAAYLPSSDERMLEHVQIALEGFEKAGDQALLAATLGDSAGLWGQVEDDWIMANLNRSVEILGSIQVPYWYGHALQTLGAIVAEGGDHDAAVRYLSLAADHLEDCGDVACWANSSRRLATAEAALGRVDDATARVTAVIDAMPILPMKEVAKPRTLDAAAEVLCAAGLDSEAAVVLGRAVATEFPVETLFPREPRHDAMRSLLLERLGDGETRRLMADGEAMTVDACIEQAKAWLAG